MQVPCKRGVGDALHAAAKLVVVQAVLLGQIPDNRELPSRAHHCERVDERAGLRIVISYYSFGFLPFM